MKPLQLTHERKKLLARVWLAALISLASGALLWIDTSLASQALTLRLSVVSTVPSSAQVFYDTGRGFSEQESQIANVLQQGIPQTLTFPFPSGRVSAIRFDPLATAGRMVITKAVVVDGNDIVMQELPLLVDALNQIHRIQPSGSGVTIETAASANDPGVQFRLASPVDLRAVSTGSVLVRRPLFAVLVGLWLLAFMWAMLPSAFHRVVSRLRRPGVRLPGGRVIETARAVLCIALLAIAVLVIIRAPHLFSDPRFWAEEGSGWFQNTVDNGLLSTLVYIFPASGYFNVFANLAGATAWLTARFVGLQYAPAATTLLSLGVLALLFSLILFGKSRLFPATWMKIAACLIVLFAPTSIGEIWLNSINAMSYLGLICVLLAFEDPPHWSSRRKWLTRTFLVVCGLSGIYAAILPPLFVGAFWAYRNREHLVMAAILTSCLTIQLGAAGTKGLQQTRVAYVTLDTALVNILFHHLAMPLAGERAARQTFEEFGLTDALATAATVPRAGRVVLAAWFAFTLMSIVLAFLAGYRKNREKAMLAGAFVMYATVTAIGSLNGVPSNRYAFIPGVLLLLLVLKAITDGRRASFVALTAVVLSFALIQGAKNYRQDVCLRTDQWGAPSWSAEVSAWRSNPRHRLRTWPVWWQGTVAYPPPDSVSASTK